MAKQIKPLNSKLLSRHCNPKQFDFVSTRELSADTQFICQDRAIESIEYGLDIDLKGFNIFVMGNPGVGKHTLTKKLVNTKSRLRSDSTDWCYAYNFANPLKPRVLKLPPGMGKILQHDLDDLIEQLHHEFSETTAFHAIELLKRKYSELPDIIDHLNAALEDIQAHAKDFSHKPRKSITLFDQPYIELPPYSR